MSGYFLFDDLKIYDVKSIQFNTVALQSQTAEKEKVSTK